MHTNLRLTDLPPHHPGPDARRHFVASDDIVSSRSRQSTDVTWLAKSRSWSFFAAIFTGARGGATPECKGMSITLLRVRCRPQARDTIKYSSQQEGAWHARDASVPLDFFFFSSSNICVLVVKAARFTSGAISYACVCVCLCVCVCESEKHR